MRAVLLKRICCEAPFAKSIQRRTFPYVSASSSCRSIGSADRPTRSAGCSGFDWSKDITDDASYRRCYLKQMLPRPNNDTRYVAGFLYSAVPALSPAIIAAG